MRKRKFFIIIVFVLYPVFCIFLFHLLVPFVWIKVDEAFHCGNYDRAIEYLSFISYMQPKNPESYILKGWLQWSEARSLCNEGLSYEVKLNEAVETYRKGQKNNPTSWKIYFEEGIMWEAFGEKEKALKSYYLSSKYSFPPYNKIYEIKKQKFKLDEKY